MLVASEPVFTALRLAGATYLVLLGLQALWSAGRRRGAAAPVSFRPVSARRALRQGLLSNLGNPKMAVFLTSLLPQFASGRATFASLLLLGLLFSALTLAWLSLYAVVVDRAGELLRRPRVRRMTEAVTGAVLVAFGLRLAAESR